MVKEPAACSNSPTRPLSLKYFPVQIPSSSGETTSSDTALSSRTLCEMCYKLTTTDVNVRPHTVQAISSASELILFRFSESKQLTSSCSGLAAMHLTTEWDDPGSSPTTVGCVYHDSHCDIQPWVWHVLIICRYSVFHSLWDGKTSISFQAE